MEEVQESSNAARSAQEEKASEERAVAITGNANTRPRRRVNATEGRAAAGADTADLETRGTIKIETLVSFGGPRHAHDAQEAQEKQAEEQDPTDEEHDASTALTVHQPS